MRVGHGRVQCGGCRYRRGSIGHNYVDGYDNRACHRTDDLDGTSHYTKFGCESSPEVRSSSLVKGGDGASDREIDFENWFVGASWGEGRR